MRTDVLDGCHTGAEIAQQPDVWREVAHRAARDPQLGRFLSDALADPARRIVLTGAGTSAFVGETVAAAIARRTGRVVEAIATTDLVAAPRDFLDDRPVLLVSFARSGDSPESVAALDLVDAVVGDPQHLIVTCNADGSLARRCADRRGAHVLDLPAESNDRGFAMTSSFTGMALAALLSFGVEVDVEALAAAGTRILDEAPSVRAASASGRLVYLGSGAGLGLAHESALKCLELTAGRRMAMADSSLGFRHGPKSMLDSDTVAVVYLSNDPYTRRYDLDIARELVADLPAGSVAVVDAAGSDLPDGATVWAVPGLAGVQDGVWSIAAVLHAQLLALASSRAAGLEPDNPFPSGEVNRVVQGVVIHPFDAGRAA